MLHLDARHLAGDDALDLALAAFAAAIAACGLAAFLSIPLLPV